NAAQLALRAVVGGVAVEALLNQRLEIGVQLLARVQPEGAKIGVNALTVEVKDVMFPADLERAFTDVLKAKQEGQAALERAREETQTRSNRNRRYTLTSSARRFAIPRWIDGTIAKNADLHACAFQPPGRLGAGLVTGRKPNNS